MLRDVISHLFRPLVLFNNHLSSLVAVPFFQSKGTPEKGRHTFELQLLQTTRIEKPKQAERCCNSRGHTEPTPGREALTSLSTAIFGPCLVTQGGQVHS